MECLSSAQPFIQPSPFNAGAHRANASARAPAAQANLHFSLLGATDETYKHFIKNLRQVLTMNSHKVYNIPVLPAAVSGPARFLLINLTNYKGESITIAVDVVNIYVVAYQARNRAYFVNDAPKEATSLLFRGIGHEMLPYKSTYESLERAAGKVLRANIELGFSELSSSIGNMFHSQQGYAIPRAFIVIIQMVSEAARFKYIEERVSKSVEKTFKPDPGLLSLENKWRKLSEQIQIAPKLGGNFATPVEVRSVKNNKIEVTNVKSKVVKGIAVLLHSKSEDNGHETKLMMAEVNGWEYVAGGDRMKLMEEVNNEGDNAGGAFGIEF